MKTTSEEDRFPLSVIHVPAYSSTLGSVFYQLHYTEIIGGGSSSALADSPLGIAREEDDELCPEWNRFRILFPGAPPPFTPENESGTCNATNEQIIEYYAGCVADVEDTRIDVRWDDGGPGLARSDYNEST